MSGATPVILVVEDDHAVRKLIHTALARQGYLFVEACDGLEAVTLMGSHEPVNLAIVDINMPGMGGLDFANALEAARPGTPVLYISGDTHSIAVESILCSHPNYLLAKPFTPAQLRSKVRSMLAA